MNECKIQDSFAHASYFQKIFQATKKYVFQQAFLQTATDKNSNYFFIF